MNLLIDECLSEELAKRARQRGHAGSSHVVWRGLRSWKDWQLVPRIVEEGWTFVTRNSVDFRGPARAPGRKGHYSRLDLHPGLICLNGPVGMDLEMQIELFEIALEEIDSLPDLLNRGLEVSLDENGEISIIWYDLPPE